MDYCRWQKTQLKDGLLGHDYISLEEILNLKGATYEWRKEESNIKILDNTPKWELVNLETTEKMEEIIGKKVGYIEIFFKDSIEHENLLIYNDKVYISMYTLFDNFFTKVFEEDETVDAKLVNNVDITFNDTPIIFKDLNNNILPTIIINDYYYSEAYLPIRALSQLAGKKLDWDQASKTINIYGEAEPIINENKEKIKNKEDYTEISVKTEKNITLKIDNKELETIEEEDIINYNGNIYIKYDYKSIGIFDRIEETKLTNKENLILPTEIKIYKENNFAYRRKMMVTIEELEDLLRELDYREEKNNLILDETLKLLNNGYNMPVPEGFKYDAEVKESIKTAKETITKVVEYRNKIGSIIARLDMEEYLEYEEYEEYDGILGLVKEYLNEEEKEGIVEALFNTLSETSDYILAITKINILTEKDSLSEEELTEEMEWIEYSLITMRPVQLLVITMFLEEEQITSYVISNIAKKINENAIKEKDLFGENARVNKTIETSKILIEKCQILNDYEKDKIELNGSEYKKLSKEIEVLIFSLIENLLLFEDEEV